MQSIIVKFHGPTDTRGSRFTARCDAGSRTVAIDHAKSMDENADRAARALICKLDWGGLWIRGAIKSDRTYTCLIRTTTPERTLAAEKLATQIDRLGGDSILNVSGGFAQ